MSKKISFWSTRFQGSTAAGARTPFPEQVFRVATSGAKGSSRRDEGSGPELKGRISQDDRRIVLALGHSAGHARSADAIGVKASHGTSLATWVALCDTRRYPTGRYSLPSIAGPSAVLEVYRKLGT